MTFRYLLTGIAMAFVLLSNQDANAQIETLVMPGKVIEGHADVETDCDSCHQKFERQRQRVLCLACHEEVGTDIEARIGYHGRDGSARSDRCASCHTDHEGRNADIIGLDVATFDHKLTDFMLEGKHTEIDCRDCHALNERYREAPSDCFGCHEADNIHEPSLGTECASCHNPANWKDVQFDHDTTGYPLVGHHTEASCTGCHEDKSFRFTPTNCYGCHAKDDAHNGRSGRECENCHNPTDWTDTSFNHARDTEFPLDGHHATLSCDDCHSSDPFSDGLQINCYSCHAESDNHKGHFGEACETCHVTEDWKQIAFDHDTDTNHPLNGAHETIKCEECHVEPIFVVKLQSDCLACHEDDDAHESTQGPVCNDCHNEISWTDNVFFDHDLTRFPLLGSHAEVECESCHDSHVFQDAPTACVDCHREEDPHEGRFTDACATCHNPVDWLQWQFDHDVQTAFPLEGAHIDVACETCHRQPLIVQARLGSDCGGCHRSDDIHNGEFGPDCGRCHSAASFRDVRSIQ